MVDATTLRDQWGGGMCMSMFHEFDEPVHNVDAARLIGWGDVLAVSGYHCH